MMKLSSSILFLLLQAGNLFASRACLEFFAGNAEREMRDGTVNLIAYLGSLLEQQVMGEEELRRMAENLAFGEWVNPIAEDKGRVSSAALLHRNEIQEYLDTANLDAQKILQWAKKKLKETENVKIRREETRNETEDLHHKMIFYPIPPGKFEMGEEKKAVSVELTHTIEMMSTLVTQKHWIDLMGKNPSRFSGLGNPVENLTWWSAIAFANELSKKQGLEPAYDLTDVEFDGEAASKGTLIALSGDLKINAPGGDIYLAEGYRLPTEAEQEYVRRNLGQARENYYFGDDEAELKKHAWYEKNSSGSTHPVAELQPLIIGDHPFFDLLGNVSEWAHDYQDNPKGGINPAGLANGPYRASRGGSWFYSARRVSQSAYRDFDGSNFRCSDVGFRLVRTIK